MCSEGLLIVLYVWQMVQMPQTLRQDAKQEIGSFLSFYMMKMLYYLCSCDVLCCLIEY